MKPGYAAFEELKFPDELDFEPTYKSILPGGYPESTEVPPILDGESFLGDFSSLNRSLATITDSGPAIPPPKGEYPAFSSSYLFDTTPTPFNRSLATITDSVPAIPPPQGEYPAFPSSYPFDTTPTPFKSLGAFPASVPVRVVDEPAKLSSPTLTRDQLAAVPCFVERFTSFVTKADPQLALETLLVALRGVDFEYLPAKQRIKGIAYPSQSPCFFMINLYARSPSEILIEIQRRRGDCIAFAQFFQKILASCQSLTVSMSHSKQALKSHPAPANPFPSPIPGSECELDDSTLEALFSMASSVNLDVKRQAAQGLASLSDNVANMKKIMDYGSGDSSGSDSCSSFVSLLETLLGGQDSCVERSAALLLRNMMACGSLLDCAGSYCIGCKIKNCPVLGRLFDILDSTSMVRQDTKRQIGHVLSALCEGHWKCIRKHSNHSKFLSTLRRACKTTNGQLKEQVEWTLSKLAMA